MAQSAPVLHLDNISIRQQGGLFSLNDLHVASGGEDRHQPAKFIRLAQTKALVNEISKSPDLAITNSGISAIESRRGFNGGTYVCRELVIAYAAWINAAFHLKVLRAFLGTAASIPTPSAQVNPLLPGEKGMRAVHLTQSERELIETLRWTTYAGRDAVRETARVIRMRYPWNDSDMPGNTARATSVQVHISMV